MLTVTELRSDQVDLVDRHLPLSRLSDQGAEHPTYLIAWEDAQPVGHAHVAWQGTHVGFPEIQDVFVLPEQRRRGIGSRLTETAEDEARRRGFDRMSLSVSQDQNPAAKLLYEKLGYVDAGVEPVRVLGPMIIRGRPLEVDDMLVYLIKDL